MHVAQNNVRYQPALFGLARNWPNFFVGWGTNKIFIFTTGTSTSTSTSILVPVVVPVVVLAVIEWLIDFIRLVQKGIIIILSAGWSDACLLSSKPEQYLFFDFVVSEPHFHAILPLLNFSSLLQYESVDVLVKNSNSSFALSLHEHHPGKQQSCEITVVGFQIQKHRRIDRPDSRL